MTADWRCVSCGAEAPDRKPPCNCSDLVFDRNKRDTVEYVRWHEWIEVGARRWCNECGSFQVKKNGKWRDTMVGPYPNYNKTDMTMHRPDATDIA